MSISEGVVHWIISDRDSASQGISSVFIEGAVFIDEHTVFTSYGLVSFKHCRFSDFRSYAYFYRSQFEAEPVLEMIKLFHNNSEGLKIVIDNCKINGSFYFHLINVIRQMHILQSRAPDGVIKVIIGNPTLTNDKGFTFVKLLVENSSIRYWAMSVYGSKSVGFLKMENTAISGWVYSEVEGGLGYLHFNNCTFYLTREWVVKCRISTSSENHQL